jgi:hypothetical protein
VERYEVIPPQRRPWPRFELVTCSGESRGPLMHNSSHQQFVATVHEATTCFPLHDDDPDTDGFDAAADNLRARLEPIDPPAWRPDGYWENLYWDITMGNYSPAEFDPPV